MRWWGWTLVATCGAFWIDALAGGGIIGSPLAVVVVAALAFAAGVSAERVALASVGVAAAGVAAVGLLSVADQVYEPGRFGLASDGVFYCVVVFAPALLGLLLVSRNRQVSDLRDRRRTLEIRRLAAVGAARAAERDRVERRIDLSLADRLGRIAADVRTADRFAGSDPDRVPARLDAVEQTARDALAELRELLGFLHNTSGGPVESVGSESIPMPMPASPSARPATGRGRAVDLVDVALVLAAVPLAVETALPGHHGAAVANVVLSLAQGAALLLVRRWPVPGVLVLLGVATAQTAAFAALPPTVGWLLPGLLASFLIGHSSRQSWSVVGLLVMIAGTFVVTLATPTAHRASAGVLPGLAMGLVCWIGGRMVWARAERARELRAITDELDRTQADTARAASAEQRAEMARDLHDVGAHALTVVCLQAGAAQTWWNRDRQRARVALAALMSVADGTLTQVGRSLDSLAHATGAHQLDPAAFDVLAGIGRALGLRVDVTVEGRLPRVGDEVARAVHLVVQEALTNAARHAIGSSVRVGLACHDTALEVRITDTGPAAAHHGPIVAVPGSGSGLRGMRERVEALRGDLTAGPCGRGFEVLARLPS